jgi:hypothetical protein
MRAVYSDFFAHYNEERFKSLMANTGVEGVATGTEDREGEEGGGTAADLLAYEELIREVVPGFTYLDFMQRITNQIGHHFTFLRVCFFFSNSFSGVFFCSEKRSFLVVLTFF